MLCTRQVMLRVQPASVRLLATQASDPVQQLFVDKIRDYGKKSAAAGGKMVDVTAEVQAEMDKQLKNVAQQFRFDSVEMASKFPDLKFDGWFGVAFGTENNLTALIAAM